MNMALNCRKQDINSLQDIEPSSILSTKTSESSVPLLSSDSTTASDLDSIVMSLVATKQQSNSSNEQLSDKDPALKTESSILDSCDNKRLHQSLFTPKKSRPHSRLGRSLTSPSTTGSTNAANPAAVLVPDSPLIPGSTVSDRIDMIPCTPKEQTDRMIYNGVKLVSTLQMRLGVDDDMSQSSQSSTTRFDVVDHSVNQINAFSSHTKRSPSAVMSVSEQSSPIIAHTESVMSKYPARPLQSLQAFSESSNLFSLSSQVPRSDTRNASNDSKSGLNSDTYNCSSPIHDETKNIFDCRQQLPTTPLLKNSKNHSIKKSHTLPAVSVASTAKSTFATRPTSYKPISTFMFGKAPVGVPVHVSNTLQSFAYSSKPVRKSDPLLNSSSLYKNTSPFINTHSEKKNAVISDTPSAQYTRPTASTLSNPNQVQNSLSMFKYSGKNQGKSTKKVSSHNIKIEELASLFPKSTPDELEKALDVVNGDIKDAAAWLRANHDFSDQAIAEKGGVKRRKLVRKIDLEPSYASLNHSAHKTNPLPCDDDDDDHDILNADMKKVTTGAINGVAKFTTAVTSKSKALVPIALSDDDEIVAYGESHLDSKKSISQYDSDPISIADEDDVNANETTEFDHDFQMEDDIEQDSAIMIQVLEFFNSATVEHITESLKCLPEASSMIVSLRPFHSGDHLREVCSTGCKAQRKLYRLVDRYEHLLEGFKEVDSLIKRCETVGNDIKQIMTRWIQNAAAISSSQNDGTFLETTALMDETNGEISLTQVAALSEDTDSHTGDASSVDGALTDHDDDMAHMDKTDHFIAKKDLTDGALDIDDEDEDESFFPTQKPKELPDSTRKPNSFTLTPLISNTSTHLNDPTSFKCLTKQPKIIPSTLQLKQYQIVGVSWLMMLYQKQLGGILADEMGLGKTAQVIAFLAHLYTLGERGPHLIVVPASTLENWVRELNRWCPKLCVASYSGSLSDRRWLQEDITNNSKLNVIVTTYSMATGSKEDRTFLRRIRIKSLILDEGHMVKNIESNRYKHLMAISAPFRLLLTGTPLQNNLLELLALLTFVMPRLFVTDQKTLERIFLFKSLGGGDESSLSHERINRAKKIMTPFVLRRRKDQVLRDLPPKTKVLNVCTPVSSQLQLYKDILLCSKKAIAASEKTTVPHTTKLSTDSDKAEKPLKSETSDQTASLANRQLSNVLMDLRKVANHPLLVRSRYTDAKLRIMAKAIMREPEHCDKNVEYIWEDMCIMSDFEIHQLCLKYKTLMPHKLSDKVIMDSCKLVKLKSMLLEMRAQGDKILVFSQFVIMLDILEPVMEHLGIKYLRLDGTTPVGIRQSMMDEFNNDPEITVFLLTTKSGGVGINLTSANVVIMYDIDYNPHNDAQAEDRAHRVGQTRAVTVHRLIMDNSIEQHILRLAEHKLELDAKLQSREYVCTNDDNKDEESEFETKRKHKGQKLASGKVKDNKVDQISKPDSSILDVLQSVILGLE
ncbi:hypothetical protein BDV3_002716 [Batrachochytrium dendrobatidis]